ncbi:MAG: hypothetical protein JST24_05620 [Acidobacteria bacterium]|nr:hypothetical protein [Acidobacteriota bacterium]
MKLALPLLIAPIFASALVAAPQAKHHASTKAPKKDAGTLTIGTAVYRFKPQTLSASASHPMSLYLRGLLVPEKGGKTLALSFQLFRPGPLGGMTLGPRTGSGSTWLATMQTKVDATYGEPPKLGAEAVFTLSGPLLESKGATTTPSSWQGQIKAEFTSVP